MILLLVGAIVNVAVAWGCAAMTDITRMNARNGNDTEVTRCESLHLSEDPFRPLIEVRENFGMTFVWSDTVDIFQQGWPFRSLEGISVMNSLDGPPVEESSYLVALRIFPTRPMHRNPNFKRLTVLVMQPLWPGFAINTIFYTAILWVVWFTPGMVRRRIRRRRGLCPTCAYPIGTSSVCTECGNAVFRKNIE